MDSSLPLFFLSFSFCTSTKKGERRIAKLINARKHKLLILSLSFSLSFSLTHITLHILLSLIVNGVSDLTV
ncbi:hypothetical protein VNO80_04383 [Phaseolus coccineus]|uniref:Uncharacterized protein n=1 Tax=Phaseolus coccineus TaxID=3886 RepID=A0AAN9RNQ1_PHACN